MKFNKERMKKVGLMFWQKFKAEPLTTLTECTFIITLFMAAILGFFDHKASVGWSVYSLYSLLYLVYMNVVDLKDWGKRIIADLVNAAEKVDKATDRFKHQTGGKVKLNEKEWK